MVPATDVGIEVNWDSVKRSDSLGEECDEGSTECHLVKGVTASEKNKRLADRANDVTEGNSGILIGGEFCLLVLNCSPKCPKNEVGARLGA